MPLFSERRALQTIIAISAIVPLAAGAAGMLQGMNMLADGALNLGLDSHMRYLSGLLFGVGLCFLSCIPRIETKTARFQLLTLIVFIGGLARLGGALLFGWPPAGMTFGLGMELIVTPLLCLWQRRVARAS
ncbi:MAG TPA: DUF4345 domain-containing protein [Alphaproteobacteria bacterium]|nr:DUF4345 domain-containing protein [Alphaproteobacteria bacterium]